MAIIATLKEFFHGRESVSAGDRLLVAVSGGPDSMALLAAMTEIAADLELQIYPLHYNYRLQEQAAAGEQVVRSWCDDHDLPLVATALQQPQELETGSGSLEAEARHLRYQFFQQAGACLGTNMLLLGHQKDDQVETVLLNLGRGSGLYGLQGMQPVSHWRQLVLLRPLLEHSRQEIMEFLRRREIPFVTDPTNEGLEFARNRLRNQVLPAWEKAQPAPAEAIYNLSRRTASENDFWQQYLKDNFSYSSWPGEVQVGVEQLRDSHPAERRRLLHFLCRKLEGGAKLSEQNLEGLEELSSSEKSGRSLHLPGELEAVREYDRLAIYRKDSLVPPTSPVNVEVPMNKKWGDIGEINVSSSASTDEGVYRSELPQHLIEGGVLRLWQAGDRIIYRGKRRKLKEIFEAERVPFRARRCWPVVVAGGEVVAVVGLAVKDGNFSEKTVIINFQPEHGVFAQTGKKNEGD